MPLVLKYQRYAILFSINIYILYNYVNGYNTMKKSSLFGILFLVSVVLNAQDIIVMKNGDLIQSKVQEITQHEIKYKKYSNIEGPLYTIDKATVLSINYQNGDKETFTTESTTSSNAKVEIGLEDVERNKRCIDAINNAHVDYLGKEIKGNASILFCKLSVTPESKLANKDIELRFTSGCNHAVSNMLEKAQENPLIKTDRWLSVSVKNKTDKTIYIDLANTFFKRGQQSFPYYTPSSTTTSSTKSLGGGVNVGGLLGQTVGGISVGGGKSTTTATTVFAQRVLAIPPHSEKTLEEQYLFPEGCEDYYNGIEREPWLSGSYHACINIKCKRGEQLSWSPINSPVSCGTLITYAFDETFETKTSMNVDLYMSEAIGGRFFWGDKTYMVQGDFTELPKSIVFFIAETGRAVRGLKLMGR